MKLVGEDELSDEFIREMEFFMRFEEDGTFDWYFYPDYCWLAALNDYQRLLPINCVRITLLLMHEQSFNSSVVSWCSILSVVFAPSHITSVQIVNLMTTQLEFETSYIQNEDV